MRIEQGLISMGWASKSEAQAFRLWLDLNI
jgi:hypothetical protein